MIIYQVIQNFILALIVCRKYGIRYNPFCNVSNGYYNYLNKSIEVNPFHNNFVSILFHEIGHHVHHKIVNYEFFFEPSDTYPKELTYMDRDDFFKVLDAEAFASRFAMKTRKANKSYLLWAFNTYAQQPFEPKLELVTLPFFTKYVDCVSKNTLKIVNH